MRNDYTPIRKAKKVARAPPTIQKRKIQKRKIQKPIVMPPIVIVPYFVL